MVVGLLNLKGWSKYLCRTKGIIDVRFFGTGHNPYFATCPWLDLCIESLSIDMPIMNTPCHGCNSPCQIRCGVRIIISLAPSWPFCCIPSNRLTCDWVYWIGNGKGKIKSIERFPMLKAWCLYELCHSSQNTMCVWVFPDRFRKICNEPRLLENSLMQVTITHRVQ